MGKIDRGRPGRRMLGVGTMSAVEGVQKTGGIGNGACRAGAI